MVAFPFYDAGAIEALNAQAVAILKLFAARGYAREEPSVLQPADIFLDRSGEEIRRRTFTLTDPSGRELCLRPDLTIPICRHAVDSKASLPARLCYNGMVFRYQPQRPHRPVQFFQAGAELLGLVDSAAGESEILSLAFEALRAVGLGDFDMRFGDLALFGALVDALELPPQWRQRLKRHFWRAGYVETLLQRLGQGGAVPSRADIETRLAAHATAPPAGRSREEILARAMERAAEAAALRPHPEVAGVITRLFGISGPAGEALAQIRALLKTAGIRLDAPLAAMEARLKTIAALGLDPARLRFTAHFGRNMEYYTGFVFELWSRDGEGPVQVAGGGRYDTLMESLGAKRAVSAIGCALRTERMLAARQFLGGCVMAALSLALPSKGRLKQACDAWFAAAGLVIEQTAGARGYRAVFAGLADIEIMLLSAGEIASSLLAGDVQLGITGEDLLREAAPELEGRMHLVRPMGFGLADVVVAVSDYWIDVSTMADLDDVCAAYAATHRRRLRVATKYPQLTRGFFAHAGIADYRIVPSAGATEGAPAAGTAEAIVDITTTGSTLKANGLKVLDDGVILKSQAQLAASLTADWDGRAHAAAEKLLAHLDSGAPLYAALAQLLPHASTSSA